MPFSCIYYGAYEYVAPAAMTTLLCLSCRSYEISIRRRPSNGENYVGNWFVYNIN